MIGDPVNAAARLSDLAKDRDSRVVASSDALDAAAVDETQHWSVVDEVTLRGRSEPTSLAIPRS